ncbi:AraC family transcriptional regulator [Rhodovulum sp. BSW8]|uniref:AraC family transcriptional regulator n=1 Tax=Rhodovulum sp. BSW8 TaxID=2259645 RepID=UPI001402394C|nr:AraC family transcriptional regulator [Rhodovulum sp. BSW8]
MDRILRAVDLPVGLLDRPVLVLPRMDHYAVLQAAGRDTGSTDFGAEMGAAVRIGMLGPYGTGTTEAPTLGAAIRRANGTLNRMMQTDTDLVLCRLRRGVRWSMAFHTRGKAGRFQNELLATGYQFDLLRHFPGEAWSPKAIRVRDIERARIAHLEQLFRAPVCGPDRGDSPVPGMEFDERCLAALNPATAWTRPRTTPRQRPCRRPPIPWPACVPPSGWSFCADVPGSTASPPGSVCRGAAFSDGPIAEIADQLGYADPAHFSRAYRRWTGFSPRAHRRMILSAATPAPLPNQTADGGPASFSREDREA